MYLANFKAKNEKKICKKIGIKSLGNIPLNSNSNYLIIESNPKSNIMKYIKDIRTNIIGLAKAPQAIAIISAYSKEGKSLVAMNIAIALARKNKKVLLINGNLREKESKSNIFYEKITGLSDFIREIDIENKLENLNKIKKYIQKTQIPNLYRLQNGTVAENSSEIINSKKMEVLLNLLKEIYQYIIIDGTSFFENEDCVNWSTMVDTNILVIEKNRANYNDLIKVKEKIEYNGGSILGFILNKTNTKHGKYYSKTSNSKVGIFIENVKKEAFNEESVEELISPIAEKLQEKDTIKFDVLHKQIKDDILIEDFINDIEGNFNTLLESFKDNNQKNTEILLEKLDQTKENMQKLLNNYNNIKNEDDLKYREFTQNIMEELKSLKKDVNNIKENKKIENDYQKVLKEIQAQNYGTQIEEIKEKIKNLEGLNNESKKSNIIDLRKIFIENRKKNNRVFSIDEPIAFEDLERLAVEVIDFDEQENILENINSK